MILANVIVGRPIILSQDRSLRQPPQIPGSKISYDSVQGESEDSTIIVLYSNKRAYPQYVITYK